MNLKPGWLLLLSISAGVWSVPIDRNAGNQEVKEEVPEENGVMVLLLSVPCLLWFIYISHFVQFAAE